MQKLFKGSLDKIIYVVSLVILFGLSSIFLLDRVINNGLCCSKYQVKPEFMVSCICEEPKSLFFFNLAGTLEHDFTIIIIIFLVLFIFYSIYYLFKTRNIKRKVINKVLIGLSFACFAYILLLCIGRFIFYV